MTVYTPGCENGRHRPRGYADWRPQARTRELLALVALILEEYQDYLPLTVRQIFYRLVGQYGYGKTHAEYKGLCDKLVRARRAKLIPFEVIRDDGIVTVKHNLYGGIEEFHDEIGRRARSYRRDRQVGQRQYIEVWCEAAGMLHQLDRVASKYSIPVYTAGGFSGIAGTYDISRRALQRSCPTTVLHLGDFDPSGESIYATQLDDAAKFVEDDRVDEYQKLVGVRVALTADQVTGFNLPTAPPNPKDSRSGAWEGETCQLETLSPDTIAGLLVDAIEDMINPDAYDLQIRLEADDRAELLQLPPGEGR